MMIMSASMYAREKCGDTGITLLWVRLRTLCEFGHRPAYNATTCSLSQTASNVKVASDEHPRPGIKS